MWDFSHERIGEGLSGPFSCFYLSHPSPHSEIPHRAWHFLCQGSPTPTLILLFTDILRHLDALVVRNHEPDTLLFSQSVKKNLWICTHLCRVPQAVLLSKEPADAKIAISLCEKSAEDGSAFCFVKKKGLWLSATPVINCVCVSACVFVEQIDSENGSCSCN